MLTNTASYLDPGFANTPRDDIHGHCAVSYDLKTDPQQIDFFMVSLPRMQVNVGHFAAIVDTL